MKEELVQNWMSKNIVTIRTEETLPNAHKLMKAEGIRRLPVLDASDKLVGIVTLGDIREADASSATSLSIWEVNYLLANLRIKKIMTPNPITVRPTQTIGEAALSMLQNKVSGLPVVTKDGKLVGMITESDIFSMVVMHEWEGQGMAIVE